MAASGGAKRRGRWTLVNDEGNIQGSDSDVGSADSSDCIVVEEDAVLFRSKRDNSRSRGTGSSQGGSQVTAPESSADHEETAPVSRSWLDSLWSKSKSHPASGPANNVDESLPPVAHLDRDNLDSDSMDSIVVLPMPCDEDGKEEGHQEEQQRSAGPLSLDHSAATGLATSCGVVEAACSTNALRPREQPSPASSRVEDLTSSSNSSQADFLMVHHPQQETDANPMTATMDVKYRAQSGVCDDRDDLEQSTGAVGPLPVMPQGVLPMSSVSVDNIPRGVEEGGSPRRVQSTGSIPKETSGSHVGVPVMTQRWPTEDGGFLLVQQFRGDGEPAMSRSSSFSDLSSSFSYPGVRRRIPEASMSSLNRQCSDTSSEVSHYSDASNDALPANMVVSGITPGKRQYLHLRDEGLNSKLTLAALLVVTAAVALVIGHYIGSTQATSHHLGIEAGQVWRLRSLQDQLVTCLDKTKMLWRGKAPAQVSNKVVDSVGVPEDQPMKDEELLGASSDMGMMCAQCSAPGHSKSRYSGYCNMHCSQDNVGPHSIETVHDVSVNNGNPDDVTVDAPEGYVIGTDQSSVPFGENEKKFPYVDTCYAGDSEANIKESSDMPMPCPIQAQGESNGDNHDTKIDKMDKTGGSDHVQIILNTVHDFEGSEQLTTNVAQEVIPLYESQSLSEAMTDDFMTDIESTSAAIADSAQAEDGREEAEDRVPVEDSPVNSKEMEIDPSFITGEPENDGPKKDGTFVEKMSAKLSDSWFTFRNLTTDLVKSASNLSVNNVTTQLKENVQTLRHQIKDAVTSLQKTNITSHLKENAQNLGVQLQEVVSTLKNGNMSDVVMEKVHHLGGQIHETVTRIQQSNITSKVKGGLQGLGEKIQETVSTLQESETISNTIKAPLRTTLNSVTNILRGTFQQNKRSTDERESTHLSVDQESAMKVSRDNEGGMQSQTSRHGQSKSGMTSTNNERDAEKDAKRRKNNKEKVGKDNKQRTKCVRNKRKTCEETKFPDVANGDLEMNADEQQKIKKNRMSTDRVESNSKKSKRKSNDNVWGGENLKQRQRRCKKCQRREEKRQGRGRKKFNAQDTKKNRKQKKYQNYQRVKNDGDFKKRRNEQHQSDNVHRKNRKGQRNHRMQYDVHHQRDKQPFKAHGSHCEKGGNSQGDNGCKHGGQNPHKKHTHDWNHGKEENEDWKKFENINWEDLFGNFDVHCHGIPDCFRNQREAALKLYEELLDYQDWLRKRCYKRHLEELEDFMEELTEFLAEPSVTDKDIAELMEDFEDMAEDLEEATTKNFRNLMKERRGKSPDPSHHSAQDNRDQRFKHNKQHKHPIKRQDAADTDTPLTVTLDLKQVLNFSESHDDSSPSNHAETKEKRKHAGYGYQSDDDWFFRRMHDREGRRETGTIPGKDVLTWYSDGHGDWYDHWMQGREEWRTGMTVWDLYEWFSKRQALRHEWRMYEMDDQSNWFLKRP